MENTDSKLLNEDTLNQGSNELTTLEEIKSLEKENTNFILLVGRSQAGKSVFVASLLHYLNEEQTQGSLEIINLAEPDSDKENQFLEKVSSFVRTKKLPDFSLLNNLNDIDCRFIPKRSTKPSVSFRFLDLSGENQEHIEQNALVKSPQDSASSFEPNNPSIIFILVTSYHDAKKDDYLTAGFLDHIREQGFNAYTYHCLLLIFDWDNLEDDLDIVRFSGDRRNLIARRFVRQQMPITYRKLPNSISDIKEFSIGRVKHKGTELLIQNYDEEPTKEIFHWIYHTLTGKPILPLQERMLPLFSWVGHFSQGSEESQETSEKELKNVNHIQVEELSDEYVLALTELQMAPEKQEVLAELLKKNQEGVLTEAEEQELSSLMEDYDQGLLKKSEALRVAVERGLIEPLSK